MPIGIKRLRYFLAVAEQGNINRAAEMLHISQSALTRSIQVLEDNVGALLFERTQRGVKLTVVGERLFEHARRIINTVRSAELDLQQLVTAGETEVRLGVNSTLPTPKILDAVFNVLSDNPRLSVAIVDSFYDSLIQGLRLQQMDLVLTALPEGSNRSDLDVEVLREYTRTMSVYARSGHPLLAHAGSAELLADAKWVISGENHYQRQIDRYVLQQNIPMPKFRLRCTSATWMKHAMLEEGYVALMSSSTVDNLFAPGTVAAIPGTSVETRTRLGLVSSPSTVRPAAVMQLATELRRLYRDPAAARAGAEVLPATSLDDA
jgi:LysR family transcriptional regulator, regulator of abg operon